jgi:hypothetical protein
MEASLLTAGDNNWLIVSSRSYGFRQHASRLEWDTDNRKKASQALLVNAKGL